MKIIDATEKSSLTDKEVLEAVNKTKQSLSKQKRPNQRSMAWVLLKGHEWNPLLKIPPNKLCLCLSGRKFKKCCLLTLPRAVTSDQAKMFREQMKQPGLVFQTKENSEKLQKLGFKT